jgi:hypothetical protein
MPSSQIIGSLHWFSKKKRQLFRQKWWKSSKIVENCQKSSTIVENHRQSSKIDENRRKRWSYVTFSSGGFVGAAQRAFLLRQDLGGRIVQNPVGAILVLVWSRHSGNSGQFFTSPLGTNFDPQGWTWPLGTNFDPQSWTWPPRGELGP